MFPSPALLQLKAHGDDDCREAAVGASNVTVTTGTEVATGTSLFTVNAGTPVITAISPNTGLQSQVLTGVVITGNFTHFATGSTVSFSSAGVTASSVSVTSATQLTATITIAANATGGPSNVTVTTGTEVATGIGLFTVVNTPVITSLTPNAGAQGATIASVAILGQFTHFVQGTSVANFGTQITVNSTTVTDSTHATANITINPTAFLGPQSVTVTTGSETATGGSFSITAGTASISSLTPNSGTQGQTGISVAIVGSNTHFTNGVTTANFGGGITVSTLTLTDATHATAVINIPATTTATTYTVTLTTQGESASITNGFTVIAGAPVLTSITPTSGTQGQTIASVAIVGSFTHFVQGTTTLSIGTGITINSLTVTDSTHLSANITVGATAAQGFQNVTATTGSEVAVLNSGFQVLPGNATISSLTPNNGQQGVTGLSVAILGSATHFVQGTTVATFGGNISVTGLTVTDNTLRHRS